MFNLAPRIARNPTCTSVGLPTVTHEWCENSCGKYPEYPNDACDFGIEDRNPPDNNWSCICKNTSGNMQPLKW